MTCGKSASPFGTLPEYRGFADSTGRRRLTSAAGFALAALALLAGGCGSRNLVPLASSRDFQRQVLQANRPVMVQFYKEGCAWCALLEPHLDRLAEEYQGRAVFAKYCLKNWLGGVTNWELRRKYDIGYYPTVILFVNGQMTKKWVVHYDIKSYRKALDEALNVPARRATPTRAAPTPAGR